MTREEWIDKFSRFLALVFEAENVPAEDRQVGERACVASFRAGHDAAQSLGEYKTDAAVHDELKAAFEAGCAAHIIDAEEAAKVPDWPDTVGE